MMKLSEMLTRSANNIDQYGWVQKFSGFYKGPTCASQAINDVVYRESQLDYGHDKERVAGLLHKVVRFKTRVSGASSHQYVIPWNDTEGQTKQNVTQTLRETAAVVAVLENYEPLPDSLKVSDIITDAADHIEKYGWIGGYSEIGKKKEPKSATHALYTHAKLGSYAFDAGALRTAFLSILAMIHATGEYSGELIYIWNNRAGQTKQNVIRVFREVATIAKAMGH